MPRVLLAGRSALAATLLVGALAACNTIPLRTAAQPETACDSALISGQLVSNRPDGLALRLGTGEIARVLWPFGYSTRGGVGSLELLDQTGRAVAREGDLIDIGGGQGGGAEGASAFVACAGTIRTLPPPG